MKRLAVVCATLVLAGCAPGTGSLPLNFANGSGSEFGNYPAQEDGEMRGPDGERCVIFNWDRPLTDTQALRLRSMSCESREKPGWMVGRDLARTVIPLSESTLKAP
ncbi:hypothetical protein M2352_000711 [Azospirillum fermentarium]|uniref:hypothetical protein n=1 Tax=Azospirillum fermentarium TaxID=1233114 RepID=UPI002227FD1F|nr:hypothetical protein [Azospirillum fermentarium]MCW2245120.1 hypothetical protein [Azospirillum fermentarium]